MIGKNGTIEKDVKMLIGLFTLSAIVLSVHITIGKEKTGAGLDAHLSAPVTIGRHKTGAGSAIVRMRRLLHLSEDKTVPKVEFQKQIGDQAISLEDLMFQADREHWVSAIAAKPRNAAGRLPAIICLPGTNGTRLHLTDKNLRLTGTQGAGWARALAAEGFLTLSMDYRGSPARKQSVYDDDVRAQLMGGCFMGELVHEVMRAVDYLQTRVDVDKNHIGITGFSLGGAMSWYAAAADPRLIVIVPVCGGAGTYDALLRNPTKTDYHSQYFYPAGFLKQFPGDQPEVFASLVPRAVLILGRDDDEGMEVEGLQRLDEEVKAVYAKHGVSDRFAVNITAGEHAYNNDMFDQVKAWFDRFLKPKK